VSKIVTEKTVIRTEKTEREPMSSIAEASILLRQVAEPRPVGDTVKAAITRASRRVSRFLMQPMTSGRAEDIWRRQARLIRAEEMDAIRKAAGTDREVQEAKNVLAEIDARIARLEALLIQDADFHSDQVAQARKALGNMDRPLD